MPQTFNLNCTPQPMNGRGPYMDQDALDRVVEHLRNGNSAQVTLLLGHSIIGGDMRTVHRDKAIQAWQAALQPYGVGGRVSRSDVSERDYAVIITVVP